MNCMKKHGGCASSERADGEKEEVSTEQGRIQYLINSIIGCSTKKKRDFVGKIPKCKELKRIRVGTYEKAEHVSLQSDPSGPWAKSYLFILLGKFPKENGRKKLFFSRWAPAPKVKFVSRSLGIVIGIGVTLSMQSF